MNTVLLTLGFHTGDAVQAERLCDWIYQLQEREQIGTALLVCDSEVHPEMQTKVRLAAEVAFHSVELVVATPTERAGKTDRSNNLIRFAARHIAAAYRTPWLWIEPDCVPLKKTWFFDLALGYYSQPKRFFGSHLKSIKGAGEEQISLARVAIYPQDAVNDIEPFCSGTAPFNLFGGKALVERSTKSRLVQQIAYNHETDFDKIRPDAVMLHSDKTGALISHLRAQREVPQPTALGELVIAPTPEASPSKGRKRKPSEPAPVT